MEIDVKILPFSSQKKKGTGKITYLWKEEGEVMGDECDQIVNHTFTKLSLWNIFLATK